MKTNSIFCRREAERNGVAGLAWCWWAALLGRKPGADPQAGPRRLHFNLPPDSLCHVAGRLRGLRIDCRQGRLWLTQAGAAADVILEPGQGFVAEGDGDIVVEPMAARGAPGQVVVGALGRLGGLPTFRNAVGWACRPASSARARAVRLTQLTGGRPVPLASRVALAWPRIERPGVELAIGNGQWNGEEMAYVALWICGLVSVAYCVVSVLALP